MTPPSTTQVGEVAPVWIRGPQLRKRWSMSESTFARKRKDKLVPEPCYPFGDSTPYWDMKAILAFEDAARGKVAT